MGQHLPSEYRTKLDRFCENVGSKGDVESTTQTCVILIADLCLSTESNTEIGQDEAVKRVLRHNNLVQIIACLDHHGELVKEMGDGIIVRFAADRPPVVQAAIDIQYALRAWNQKHPPHEQIATKIAIAHGPVHTYGGSDILGLPVALASRVVSAADPGDILVTDEFYNYYVSTIQILKQCGDPRPLSLKGIDPNQSRVRKLAWHAEDARLQNIPIRRFRYFPERADLEKAYNVPTILDLAMEGSDVLVIGRSLKYWSTEAGLLKQWAEGKRLSYRFLLLDPTADMSLFEEAEENALRDEIPQHLRAFKKLEKDLSLPSGGLLRVTGHAFPESLTFFRNDFGEEILIFDISLNDPARKAALEIADESNDDHCLYKELNRRAERLFDKGRLYEEKDAILSRIANATQRNPHPDKFRNSGPTSYLGLTGDLFESIVNGERRLLPPVCVQYEISNKCNTRCTKCQRWKNGHGDSVEQPTKSEALSIIRNLASSGVKSLIFSGGEPLLHHDFPDLARAARDTGMHLGLLTDGVRIGQQPELCDVLLETMDWIRISIDGSSNEVYSQERAGGESQEYYDLVISGLRKLQAARHGKQATKLGLCYTITQTNHADVGPMLQGYAKGDIPGDTLVFKFAHCANGNGKSFVCSKEQVESVFEQLGKANEEAIRQTNIPFLQFLLGEDYMNYEDIASGRPVRRFYQRLHEAAKKAEREGIHCLTSYLFALVDAEGDLYPCCHLYYDNQEVHGKWAEKRGQHRLGNIAERPLTEVWNRRALKHFHDRCIDPSVCGECTRHFLDNEVLNDLLCYYRDMCAFSQAGYRDLVEQKFPLPQSLFF